ncbi:MAG: AmmeMemoRadiSam system protein B [Gemmataceae bacterium]|nr:AmmeMemoRadiSam system protein B [Gemmataceae bacterium]
MTTHPEPLDPSYRPRLRPGLSAEPAGDGVVLLDRLRVGQVVQVSPFGLEVVKRFDGRRTIQEIQLELIRLTGGQFVPLDAITRLAAGLDQALLLDTPRFRDRIGGPVRKPSCIGCYDGDPTKLRAQLTGLFTAPGGPGLPNFDTKPTGNRLRAALLPHMDFARGNVTYGWGFKELVEQTDATVFVVVATSHYSPHRFTLTRQHFETPLGVVETDQRYVDRLEAGYGDGLFEDSLAHIPEHSIELEIVLLQFLLAGRRPCRIVPLLVGSFGDCVEEGNDPAEAADIAGMVGALRKAEAACGEPVCYLISGDLAHIGPKFGDDRPAAGPWLDDSRRQDDAICRQITAADPAAYYGVIAAEKDERRICGLPPTWLTLAAARPRSGRVLHYQQFVHPEGHESVSFAAAAFYA